MSHSIGQVQLPNKRVLYCEYDGTCNRIIPNLYNSGQEVLINWRNHTNITCKCNTRIMAEFSTSYGYGMTWGVEVCPKCMCITNHFSPYSREGNCLYDDGIAEWWEDK